MNTENKWLAKMQRRPTTPGEALDDLMDEYGLNQVQVAEQIGVSRATVSRLINGHHALTLDMAIRLGRLFGDGPRIWLAMQQQVDEWDALHTDPKPYAFIKKVSITTPPVRGVPARGRRHRKRELAKA